MRYIKNLSAYDRECENLVFLYLGVEKTTMATIDNETGQMRLLFLDISENVSIPTAVFVCPTAIDSPKYYYGASAICVAHGGYNGLLFTHFADNLALIDHVAIAENGENDERLTNKVLLDAYLRHIISLICVPELRVLNRMVYNLPLHVFAAVGHCLDKNSSFYFYHSDLFANASDGVEISFVDTPKRLVSFPETEALIEIHSGQLVEMNVKTLDLHFLGDLFSTKAVIHSFLKYVYHDRTGETADDVSSCDIVTLNDLIEKMTAVSEKRPGVARRIEVLSDGEEQLFTLRQSDMDYFYQEMPILFGKTDIYGFHQARILAKKYISRATSKNKLMLMTDEYSPLFQSLPESPPPACVCSESDVLSWMVAEYQGEMQILEAAVASVQTYKRSIRAELTKYYQCREVFAWCSGEIKNMIIVPMVRSWGMQMNDQSLSQLCINIDKAVRTELHNRMNGGKIEIAILQLKKNHRICDVIAYSLNAFLTSVLGSGFDELEEIDGVFEIADRYFEGWKTLMPRMQSIQPCLVNAKGFFDFFNDNMPINISKRATIGNRFVDNIDSYCKDYFDFLDNGMYQFLEKEVFKPLIDGLSDYATEQYKLHLARRIAS